MIDKKIEYNVNKKYTLQNNAYYLNNKEIALVCSQRKLREEGNGWYTRYYDVSNQSVSVISYPETCGKCLNRELVGNNCVLK